MRTDTGAVSTSLSIDSVSKILFVSPVADHGGAESVLLGILRLLDRSRFLPLAAVLKAGPLAAEIERLGVRTAVLPTGRLRSAPATVGTIVALRRLIHSEGVDVVFGNMAMGHVYGGLAALGTAARAVWFQHGVVARPGPVDALAASLPARRVFAFSEAVRRSQSKITDERTIVVLPAGIELARFDGASVRPGILRGELGLGPEALVVACVARLQRGKGQLDFLEAAARLMPSCPDAHYVLAGGSLFGLEPGYEAELRAAAAGAPAPERVHFLGHRGDLPSILKDVDLLVQPTRSPEGLGLAVLEAMAMSVPVVATRLGGFEETVAHGETGWLVPPGDVGALTEAVGRLLDDARLREAMGTAGRLRVEQRFSDERMVREMERVLERVAAER